MWEPAPGPRYKIASSALDLGNRSVFFLIDLRLVMVGSRTEKGTRRLIREKADCKLWFEVHCLFILFSLFIYRNLRSKAEG